MGDTVTALPAFTAIKNNFPNAQIDLLTNKFQPGKVYINEILPLDFFKQYFYYEKFVDRGIIRQLRLNKYDLYIEIPTYPSSIFFELRSIIIAKRIYAKSGIGWHVSSDKLLRKIQQKLLTFDTNRTRLLGILKQYQINIINTGWMLEKNSVVLPEFDTSLILKSKTGKKGIIALVTGAGLPEKKWPMHNFISIAKHFSTDNYLVLLIGGKQDFIACEPMANENIINLCGKLSVLENAVILKKCSVVVSNDTGPMHLAYSVGTPVVTLFNALDYTGKWSPPQDGHSIIIRTEKRSMEMISIDEVTSAVNHVLSA